MDITICIKAKKFDNNSMHALAEYCKRMSIFCKVSVNFYKTYEEFPLSDSPHNISFVVAPGINTPSSPALAEQIKQLQVNGYSSIYYYVCEDASTGQGFFPRAGIINLSCFSMSRNTTAIVLTEQLYRAFTILNNITYHK